MWRYGELMSQFEVPGSEPFRLQVPQSQLDDLRERLDRTRWPEPETVDDWSQGIPRSYLRELCRHWAEEYDWRATEARINAVPQFRVELDGLGIHFLHARSPHEGALPLLLTHGWPGSIVEFLDVLGPLTDPLDPADAFHVVVPSLPGYGFSDKPAEPGWGPQRVAGAWAELMARLGYDRYAAQGGDWGSIITAALGSSDPRHLAGIHLTMPVAAPPEDGGEQLTDAQRAALADREEFRRVGTGYAKQQSTRPQTLGYGLVDSPAAQCAWIVEKFWAWTDCGGHPENVLSRQTLLDNVMFYWLPGAGASSARLYWEAVARVRDRVDVPTGASIFPKEMARLPRPWLERRFTDLRYYRELDSGGHFASLERPEAFVDELRTFFRTLR